MAYALRQRKQNINYADSDSPGSDSIGSDTDYLSRSCNRQKRRRNLTLCSPATKETKAANSSVNLTARRRQGQTSKRSVQEVQNKEASDATSSNNKNGTLSAEQPSSNKITILSWLIDCNVIKKGEHVTYSNKIKGSTAKRGRIAGGEILCSCCQREYSVWAFEKHCGSDLKQPYEHIYLLENQKSLLECMGNALENCELKHQETRSFLSKRNAQDKHDYACPVCGDGGDLICCDKCPSTYHLNCLNMERLPEGKWFCPYCVCQHCGHGDKSKQLIKCFQCNKKFDWGCFKEFEKETLKDALDLDCSRLYCQQSCRKTYEKLESLVGVRNEVDESYSWRVIRQMEDRTSTVSKHQYFENNAKLVVTWKLMDEAFETIVDRYTGLNVVQSVLYSLGSKLPRADYSRFYTFILEKDDEIVSAASVRIHWRRLADMPFMATHKNYQRKGYGRYLLAVVESVLRDLKVENLIIPSIRERGRMWQEKFGFCNASLELKRELALCNILMFFQCLMLCKDLTLSTAKSDVGDQKEERQTDILNVKEPQNNPIDRSLLDLNVPPSEECTMHKGCGR